MVELHDLEPGDAGWLVMRHAELYAASDGFDTSFEALVAEVLADFLRNRDAPVERGWIAREEGVRLGSIFCVRQNETIAKLRLFLVEPAARGKGIGQMLLTACLDHARAQGFARMELWTHAEHEAACALYARNGFALMSSKPVVSFGVALTEQMWGIDL